MMVKYTNVCVFILLLISYYQCSNVGVELAHQIRAAAPPEQPHLGSFVNGIVDYMWVDHIAIQSSQINDFVGIARDHHAAGRNFHFTPFVDLPNLRFGTTYHKIHLIHHINVPGFNFVQATAVKGTRIDGVIHYKAVYGMIVANGVQLFNVESVRKCKKRFLGRKCWHENVNVPRGVHPHEFNIVVQGLERILFVHLAHKSEAGRLLRETESIQDFNLPAEMTPTELQVLGGVEESDFKEALSSLLGEEVDMRESSIRLGEALNYRTKSGNDHVVLVEKDGSNTLTIFVSPVATSTK